MACERRTATRSPTPRLTLTFSGRLHRGRPCIPGRHHRRDCLAAGRGRAGDRPRSAARGLRTCLEGCFRPAPPLPCRRSPGPTAVPGALLAARHRRAAAGRTVSLAGQAKLHGPAGGRNPHARLAAALGGPAADRLRRGAGWPSRASSPSGHFWPDGSTSRKPRPCWA